MKRYNVQKQAGEGAYGVVLKCYDKEENTYVAVKKFKGKEDDATIREVKLLRALKHPNIINMKDAFRVRGKLHLVFPFMERNMLEVLQQQPRGIPEREVKEYVYQLCLAIHHCHRHGVMHRDIKPENLLVNADRYMCLCDFGVARALSKSGKHTDYVATRWYRAPELLVGRVDYSLPVDMFAIGCIMSEMLTGRPLFPGKSELDQLHILHRVMGALPADLDSFMRQNSRFRGKIQLGADRAPGSNTSDLRRYRPLNATLRGYLSEDGLAFMRRLLELDPGRRMTSKEALRHPYFDDARDVYDARVREARAQRKRREGGDRDRDRDRDRERDRSGGNHRAMAMTMTEEQREALRRRQQLHPAPGQAGHGSRGYPTTAASTAATSISGSTTAASAAPGADGTAQGGQRLPTLGTGTASTTGFGDSAALAGGRDRAGPLRHGGVAALHRGGRSGYPDPARYTGRSGGEHSTLTAAAAAYGAPPPPPVRSHAAEGGSPHGHHGHHHSRHHYHQQQQQQQQQQQKHRGARILPSLRDGEGVGRGDRALGQPRTEEIGGKVSGFGGGAAAPRLSNTQTAAQGAGPVGMAPHAAFGRRTGRRGPRRIAFGDAAGRYPGHTGAGGAAARSRALPSLGAAAGPAPSGRRAQQPGAGDALDRLVVGGRRSGAGPGAGVAGGGDFRHGGPAPGPGSRLPKLGDPSGGGWGGRSGMRQRLGRNVLGGP